MSSIAWCAGYSRSNNYRTVHSELEAPPPDLRDGADIVLRVLELVAPKGTTRKALRFSDCDLKAVASSVLPSDSRVIARSDYRTMKKETPMKVLITFGLSCVGGNPDAAMRDGIQRLFAPRPPQGAPQHLLGTNSSSHQGPSWLLQQRRTKQLKFGMVLFLRLVWQRSWRGSIKTRTIEFNPTREIDPRLTLQLQLI